MKKFLICSLLMATSFVHAGTITIVGNGAGGGPVFTTSKNLSIDIGTRVRIGTFTDLSLLTTAINNFLDTNAPVSYAATLTALNNNFVDLGTGATNYGATSQTANGGASFTPSTSQFGFNNITSLTVNGVTGNWNTFNGSLNTVNYSLSLGTGKNLYIWTAFNGEIGIVRNADGTGTASWITPASDGSNVTMNLSGLQAVAGGSMQAAEVLLGTITDYSSGPDLIALIPEPSTVSYLLISLALPLIHRKRTLLRKNK